MEQRIAIICRRKELSSGPSAVANDRTMRELGERLGYQVDATVVEIDPRREGSYTTVMLAIRRTQAAAVIVMDLEHVDGIDRAIRDHAELITVEGERVLERIHSRARESA